MHWGSEMSWASTAHPMDEPKTSFSAVNLKTSTNTDIAFKEKTLNYLNGRKCLPPMDISCISITV